MKHYEEKKEKGEKGSDHHKKENLCHKEVMYLNKHEGATRTRISAEKSHD